MKTVVSWICRLLLGGIFIFAAIAKLIQPADFIRDIDHFALVPYPLAFVAGVFLPWLELVCGIAVIIRWRERGALLLLLALCGVFGFALTSAWWRDLDINCGCFGHSADSSLLTALFRDLALGFIAVFLLRTSRTGGETHK